MLQVVEAVIERRYLPGKEEVGPEAPQSHSQSQDEGEHGPVLETDLPLNLLDRLARMVGRHLDRLDRPLDGLLDGLAKVLLYDLPDAGSDVLSEQKN